MSLAERWPNSVIPVVASNGKGTTVHLTDLAGRFPGTAFCNHLYSGSETVATSGASSMRRCSMCFGPRGVERRADAAARGDVTELDDTRSTSERLRDLHHRLDRLKDMLAD